MDKREWKTQALWYLIRCKNWKNSKYRQEREYAHYLERFFFGDGELSFDCKNETFRMRMERHELPMPTNIYLYG